VGNLPINTFSLNDYKDLAAAFALFGNLVSFERHIQKVL
jgi:hypothetical protein